jgi:hypothetical protein
MTVQIQLRRGTASQWTTANPTLALAEMGIETDTNYFKIGNGSTVWNSLPYGGLRGYVGSTGYTGSVGIGYTGSASTVIGYTGSVPAEQISLLIALAVSL